MDTLQDRLRLIRGAESQVTTANRVGINVNTLRNYENGKSLPNTDILARYVQNYGVLLEWLVMGKGPMYFDQTHDQNQAQPPQEQPSAQAVPQTEVEYLRQENTELRKDNRELRHKNGELQNKIEAYLEEVYELRLENQALKLKPDREEDVADKGGERSVA